MNTYSLSAILTFVLALLAVQNALATHQSLFGYPVALWFAGAVLFWMGQKKQRVL